MFRNYLKIAWRNLQRKKSYAIINITGLAVGLASFMVILIYLNYELSYDKWDASLKRVYKVSLKENGDILQATPAPLADFLAQTYPDAEAATSCEPAGDFEYLISAGGKKIYQPGSVSVLDSMFFKVFPYTFTLGDRATALNRQDAIVLSEEVSKKLFGNTNCIGKIVQVYNTYNLVVTGVFKQPATPSHLNVAMVWHDQQEKQNKSFWSNYSFQTYIKLKHPVTEAKLEQDINRIYYEGRLKKGVTTFSTYNKSAGLPTLFTDAVANLHNFPKHGESHFTITLALLVLAVFLLVAGAINFSNLAVAKAVTRAKEVGIRKVLGSKKIHILIQALFEIAIQCFASLVLAALMVNIMLSYFSSSFNVPLSLHSGNVVSICLQIAGSLLVIILVSGLYPALFLSNFQTAEVLKGKLSGGNKGVFFRNSLLVVQLTLSALFITGIIVINRQINYMQTKDLGFNASQVIRITSTWQSREQNFASVQSQLMRVPGVEFVAKSTTVPGDDYIDTTTSAYKFAGKQYRFNGVKVSVDYFKVMDIKLLQGRLFANNHPEDLNNTAIINESSFKLLGVADATGRPVIFPYCDTLPYTIVGVVKDFNIQGMQTHVVPTIYSISNEHCGFRSGGAILVKVNTARAQQTIAGIDAVWKKIEPDFPIRYAFLDQSFQKLFVDYERLGKIVLFFSIVSVLIAVAGLFALTSFLAQQRVKEIGVRKVLGASITSITALLSKDFVKLVIVAILIATPAAWWALNNWLSSFAYRINLSWWMFGLAGLATVAITLVTVSVQAIRAAMANPVEALSEL